MSELEEKLFYRLEKGGVNRTMVPGFLRNIANTRKPYSPMNHSQVQAQLRYLGWNELDDGCRIVEWPDRAPGLVEQADLSLTFSYEDGGRSVDIKPLTPRAHLF